MHADGQVEKRRLPLPVEPLGRMLVWLRGSSTGLVSMALGVGAATGLGAVAFRFLIGWLTMLFTGHVDYSVADHDPHPALPALGAYFLLLVPVVGGLVYGPLVERFAPEARGHGVPEVMFAIAEQGGRIRPRVAIIKAVASALCIATGGSVGREGPVVQVGSAIGSTSGQLFGFPESRMRILVACGAAAGISATFDTPIAGVMFGLELILRDFEAQSFGVVVLSSVIANAVAVSMLGGSAFLTLPPFTLVSPWELLVYAGLGLAAALVGIAFVRVLYALEELSDRYWRGPLWLRPAAGGLLLGGILLALPEMYGVGHAVLERAIGGEYVLSFLLLLLAGKILATSLTIAIGGSGGVFAPSLFIGAMLGTAYGQAVHTFFPSITGDPGAYGLVGMGAVFAAAARAPITSAIIILELTNEYSTIPPLLFAVAVATAVSAFLSADTIYTLKLRLRGIELGRPRGPTLMEVLTVGDAMGAVPETLAPGMAIGELMERLHESDAAPLIDAHGKYEGTVTAREIERAIRENTFDTELATHAHPTPKLRVSDNLARAVDAIVKSDLSGLPVLDLAGQSVVGWITHKDILRAYRDRLEREIERSRKRTGARVPPLAELRGYRVVDLEVERPAAEEGVKLSQIPWPPSALVLFVREQGEIHDAEAETTLAPGDRVTVLVRADEARALARVFREVTAHA